MKEIYFKCKPEDFYATNMYSVERLIVTLCRLEFIESKKEKHFALRLQGNEKTDIYNLHKKEVSCSGRYSGKPINIPTETISIMTDINTILVEDNYTEIKKILEKENVAEGDEFYIEIEYVKNRESDINFGEDDYKIKENSRIFKINGIEHNRSETLKLFKNAGLTNEDLFVGQHIALKSWIK